MTFTPSSFDAEILSIVGTRWEPLSMSLPSPRALIDENDIAQPDGMPFFLISSRGAPFFCEGLAMIFSFRDNGSMLVAHGVDGNGGPVIEFMDRSKIMELLLDMGDVIDEDVRMADAKGCIGAFSRAGHVCLR